MQDYRIINLFWLWWTLATTLGFSGGMAIAVAITDDISLTILLVGMAGGFAQWLVLRNRLRKAHWWILATILGLGLGIGLGCVALVLSLLCGLGAGMASPGIPLPGPLSCAIALAVAGAVLGGAQWLVLTRQIRRAGWWIQGMTLGCSIGGLVGLYMIGLPIWKALGEDGLMVGSTIGISSVTGTITGYWLSGAEISSKSSLTQQSSQK